MALVMSDCQIKKFWARVERQVEPIRLDLTPCWEWSASKTTSGYGNTTINSRTYYAHRVALWLTKGIDPSEGEASHACDNRKCVNPDHLTVADHTFNMSEALDRGRMKHAFVCGNFHHASKLTEEDVAAIRTALAIGTSQGRLADRWNVSRSTIKDIKHWRTWRNRSTNEVRVSTAIKPSSAI